MEIVCHLFSLTSLSSTFLLLATIRAEVSITATEGEDIILPCSGRKVSKAIFVLWTFQNKVLLKRDLEDMEQFGHPDYTDRVVLLDSQLKKGDLSVILKKVTLNDTGRYECQAEHEDNYMVVQFIHLTVEPPAAAGADVPITATEGVDTVLPCTCHKDTEAILLLWTDSDQNKKLLAFRHGRVLKGYEHPDYTGRVVLLDSQLNKGDLSVILKKVTLNDTGTYKCTAVYEDGQEISQSIRLTVKPPGVFKPQTNSEDSETEPSKVPLVVGLVVGAVIPVVLGLLLLIWRYRSFLHKSCNSTDPPYASSESCHLKAVEGFASSEPGTHSSPGSEPD